VDVWDLSCDLDQYTSVTVNNKYGWEMRLARNQFLGDDGVTRCPLKRDVCTYGAEPEDVVCDRSANKVQKFLHGYTATITVQQLDENFAFWRGVSKCEVETWETTEPLVAGDQFYEKIIMIHKPIDTFSFDDVGKVAIIAVSIAIFIYGVLYFCRRKNCEYCQAKLVFSPTLCYKCMLVGADVPDPRMLAAIRARGVQMQGTTIQLCIKPTTFYTFYYIYSIKPTFSPVF
jgi:hypothetical protein